MYTALVRKSNILSRNGDKVLGYAAVVVRDNGSIVVREYSACTRKPESQIQDLRKNAQQAAKQLKCQYKEMLEVTI